ncbi:hypothetical protein JKG47_01115 [Acidithiobacillus sp. MC6.1]|nr:hypothetical protein [Acidithiobacillus sp. MC6.1]
MPQPQNTTQPTPPTPIEILVCDLPADLDRKDQHTLLDRIQEILPLPADRAMSLSVRMGTQERGTHGLGLFLSGIPDKDRLQPWSGFVRHIAKALVWGDRSPAAIAKASSAVRSAMENGYWLDVSVDDIDMDEFLDAVTDGIQGRDKAKVMPSGPVW